MSHRLAFSPLPYYLTREGMRPDLAPPLEDILRQIADAGYAGVPVEIPAGMAPADYATLLNRFGLEPCPGYFQAAFDDAVALGATVEQARRLAADHARLGLDRIFVAERFPDPVRLQKPAQGADADRERLARIADGLTSVAEAMQAEGVTPCLHPHIGTRIETPEEADFVLAAVPPSLLLFGPDVGHLAWAGADPVATLTRYADRLGAVHLKDIRLAVAARAREQEHNVRQTTGVGLWAIPGEGDLDFAALLRLLAGRDLWMVVEVDIADRPTVSAMAHAARQWFAAQKPDAGTGKEAGE